MEEIKIPEESLRLESLLDSPEGEEVIKIMRHLILANDTSFDRSENELKAARFRGASAFGRELLGSFDHIRKKIAKTRTDNELIRRQQREKDLAGDDPVLKKREPLPHVGINPAI